MQEIGINKKLENYNIIKGKIIIFSLEQVIDFIYISKMNIKIYFFISIIYKSIKLSNFD